MVINHQLLSATHKHKQKKIKDKTISYIRVIMAHSATYMHKKMHMHARIHNCIQILLIWPHILFPFFSFFPSFLWSPLTTQEIAKNVSSTPRNIILNTHKKKKLRKQICTVRKQRLRVLTHSHTSTST